MGHLGRATCTVYLFSTPRPARNETNVPLYKIKYELTVLRYTVGTAQEMNLHY